MEWSIQGLEYLQLAVVLKSMIQDFAFAAMEWSIQGLEYLQLVVVLKSMIQDFAFAAMEESILSLAYPQLVVVLKSMMRGSGSVAMGGYRQAVVAMENNKLTFLLLLLVLAIAWFMVVCMCNYLQAHIQLFFDVMPTAVLFDVSILNQPPSSAHMHVQNFWRYRLTTTIMPFIFELDCGVCVLFTNLAACTRTLQIQLHAFVLQSEAFWSQLDLWTPMKSSKVIMLWL